jgi:hypothetical protein
VRGGSKASAAFFEPFAGGPMQTSRLRRSVIGTQKPKKLLIPLGCSGLTSVAPDLKKSFAELFFRKATALFP